MKHPQAEILIAIANGEKKVQYQDSSGSWNDTQIDVALGCVANGLLVRIRPNIISINGIEVPDPVRDPLEIGQEYFTPDLREYLYHQSNWDNDSIDRFRLEHGLIHLTKEAAVAHARALLSFTEAKT